jgi:hypothetical protein
MIDGEKGPVCVGEKVGQDQGKRRLTKTVGRGEHHPDMTVHLIEIDVFSGGSHRVRVNVNRETLRDAEGHCGDREDARPGANVEGTGRERARQEGVEELETPLGRLVLPCSERPPRADLNDALPDAGRDALPWRGDPHAPDSNRPKVDLPGLLPSAVVELKEFNRAQGPWQSERLERVEVRGEVLADGLGGPNRGEERPQPFLFHDPQSADLPEVVSQGFGGLRVTGEA